ncbi:MAG: MMPL family transporter [Deltaproteobacteria bacterium]|nr:MMPL family transporter [Deltaproteobacteria bacterium]
MLVQDSPLEVNNRRVIVAQPVLDFDSVFAAAHAMEMIHRLADDLGYTAERGVSVRITGNPALNYEEMIGIAWDVGGAGVFCFALVVGILVVALRSIKLVLAAVIALLSGLIWTLAFAAFSIGQLNLVSVTFAVLFIGLGVDFAIHLGMSYEDLLRTGKNNLEAMEGAVRKVGSSLALCTVTTAIGFFVFIPTDYRGVAELGLIAGAGMFIILFITLTLIPALLYTWLAPSERERHLAGSIGARKVVEWAGLSGPMVDPPRSPRRLGAPLGSGRRYRRTHPTTASALRRERHQHARRGHRVRSGLQRSAEPVGDGVSVVPQRARTGSRIRAAARRSAGRTRERGAHADIGRLRSIRAGRKTRDSHGHWIFLPLAQRIDQGIRSEIDRRTNLGTQGVARLSRPHRSRRR